MDNLILSGNINNQVMILDLENRIIEVNEKIIGDTGLSAEELIGRRCHDVFHDQPCPPNECPLQVMLEAKTSNSCPMLLERLNGTFQVSVYPICDADGKIEKVLHVVFNLIEAQN